MTEPPAWATQVPSAPVTQRPQPSAAAYQMTQLSSQQVAAMQQQLLESIWQGFLQIVDGFLLPDTSGSDQLAAWWADLQATFNSINASLTQNWLNFQNLINSVVGGIDKDVMDLIAALNSTSDSVAVATANWDTLFLDLGFSVTTAAELAAWLGGIDGSVSAANADITDIVDSFAPGGTVTEFQTGVTNLLALVGLTPASIGGATVIDTVWTAIITDIINPLNAIEIAAVNGLASALSGLLGTTAFQSLLDGIANVMGHSGTGHTIANIETYLGLIPPANVTNVLGGANLGADVAAVSSSASGSASTLTSLLTNLFGAPAVGALTTVEQDIANFISNAISGGNAPTSTNSPVAFLNNLLGIGGIPHVNVAIPASPGSGTITWDANASATPYAGPASSLVTVNHNHTCGATANYLTARIGFYAISSPAVAVTYNGQTMSPLATITGLDGQTYEMFFGLPFPPVGASYQLSVSLYAPIGFSPVYSVTVESDSYIGVGSVGATAIGSGQHSNPAQTVSSAAGDYIVQGFCNSDTLGLALLSSYNQTARYNSGNISPSSGPAINLQAGDAAGASSVSFTATAADTTNNNWVAAAVNLVPLPSTVLGSTFRAANTVASPVTSTTGNNLFPNSFFNTTVVVSNDLSYSAASGNTVTIAHAGTYSVTIAVLLVSGYVNQWVGMNLIQNGGTPKRGHTSWIGGSSSSTVCAFTFQVVCSAGDTLQPGYNVSLGASSFTGTTDGLATYFEVSLNNRGLLS